MSNDIEETRAALALIAPQLPEGKRLRLNLTSVDSVRVEMAKVYRSMKVGKLDPATGCKFVFVLTQLARLIETSVLERRVEQLERESNG